jgi:arginyl-tRNA--protein-N-Asp/Glu arginylyltransferase
MEKAKFEKESFELYKKYCRAIHNKKKESANSYENFLCM